MSRFLGIPYAAPPVGALRFQPPASARPHAAPLAATAYGAPCPQSAALGTPGDNEDCLTLNVFRPDHGRPGAIGPRPVLVFLYGGSFKYGASSPGPAPQGPNYDAGTIAARTGAVVVTLNYRLGVLGFLASPVLDAGDPRHVSGNYGLLDQQAALRWIRDNARAFGGDPGRVTLFGQSAGALSTIEQMISPGARNLFQAAEIESPGAVPAETLAKAENNDAPILTETGCNDATDTAACLRAAPVSALLASDVSVGPNVDGVVIPAAPDQLLKSGTIPQIPTVIMTDHDEGTYFVAAGTQRLGHPLTAAGFRLTLEKAFGNDDASAIEAAYPLQAGSNPGQVLASVLTDEFFACPAKSLRDTLAQRLPVLQAEFAQPSPILDYPVPMVAGIASGDAHTSELAYVFGHDGSGVPLAAGPDRDLSDAMIDGLGLLAQVAGAAPPTGVSLAGEAVLSLSTPLALSNDFATAHQCAFWKASGIAPKLIEQLD